MKQKVLFIMHMPPPIHGAAMVGQYIHDSKIINDEFECHYINLATSEKLSEIGKFNWKKIFRFFNLLFQIIRLIKKTKPNLIYITPNAKGGAFIKDFIIVQCVKIVNHDIVIHYHNKGVSSFQNKPIYNLLYSSFFKNIKVILLAEPLYYDIKKYVNRDNVYICANGIPDTNKNIQINENTQVPTILFLSNMMKEKGVYELLDACCLLRKRGAIFKCIFIGAWKDICEKDFRQKCNDYELNEFVYALGPKYGDEKIEFLRESDIFVFPTYYHNECFPLVLLEAMSYGKACISTNIAGIPTIIDNKKTGVLVKPNDSIELANTIEILLKDSELRKKMGKEGRKKFEREFTLECFEKRFVEIIRGVTE